MFRFALVSLLVAATSADIFGTANIKRQLQDFDLDQFQFNFAGININADLAQTECPTEWQETVGCVVSGCANFMDVCPDFDVPEEMQGTVPPMDGNMTMANGTMPVPPDPADSVPTCEEIDAEFCAAFGGEDLEGCCLLDCAAQIQALVVCIVKQTTGEDRSDCEIPVCPTSSPGATSDGTPAPAPADAPAEETSAAVSFVSRVAVFAGSAIAYALL